VNLTLGVLAGVVLLLPGLIALSAWNLRASRSGASRPELPLTAVSVLVIAIGGSLVSHLVAYFFAEAGLRLAVLVGDGLQAALPALGQFLPGHHLPVVQANPFVTILSAAEGKPVSVADLTFVGIVIVAEMMVVTSIIAHDGFDLLLDGFDLANQGWVYQHVIRPSKNGYRPIAHVLTTTQLNGYGIGYRGLVADIRQSEKGETLAISLLDPERFLYGLNTHEAGEGAEPSFERHAIDHVGGVVSIEAKSIFNIVVQNVLADLVDDIEEEPGPDVADDEEVADV
jgi:hypothetical protein